MPVRADTHSQSDHAHGSVPDGQINLLYGKTFGANSRAKSLLSDQYPRSTVSHWFGLLNCIKSPHFEGNAMLCVSHVYRLPALIAWASFRMGSLLACSRPQ